MDRLTVQYGQDPLETDVLQPQQFAMAAMAKLSETALGIGAVVDGFTLVPTAPASLSAVLSGGTIYQQENLEATAWSSLPVDTHTIVKQGINLNTTTLTFVAPTTTGYAQCTLIQAAYAETDTGAVVRPYYNAANPAVGFNGPGNAGTADNTIRKAYVAIQPKVGIAAASGAQVVPSPDPGFVGLYYVTLAAGATTVTAGNITLYPGAPFLYAKLGQLPSYIQNDTPVFCIDQGTASNSVLLTPIPAFAAYQPGQQIKAKLANAITGPAVVSISGLGNRPLVRQGGAACVGGEAGVGDHVLMSVRDEDVQIVRLTLSDISISATSNAFVNNLFQSFPADLNGIAILTTPGSGTWTPPAGVTSVEVEAFGGGDGGSSGTTTSGGGGGGAGSYGFGVYTVTPGTAVPYVIGAGGSGATSANNFGSPGGTTSFGTFLTAPGAPITTASPAGVFSGQYGAPAGTGGLLNLAGTAGTDGALNGVLGGNGGSTKNGAGGRGGIPNGESGHGYGSGGGGAYPGPSGVTPLTGGNGSGGALVIRWRVPRS